jgi:molecular chaperone GrpE (heat shock protein)
MSEEPVADEPEASAEGESTEEEHVPEDPEVVAIKEEIAQLESELKSKQSTLQYAQDQVEEYSKGGYARKVAEMENMRRVRKVSISKVGFIYLFPNLLALPC